MNTYEENVSILENIYMSLPAAETIQLSHRTDEVVDEAIHLLALSSPEETVDEVIARSTEMEEGYLDSDDYAVIDVIRKIHAHWFKSEKIVHSDNNLLHKPHTGSNWKTHYQYALAHFMKENGSPLKAENVSYYSSQWIDTKMLINGKPPEVVAVLNIKEDTWSSFEGTFVESEKHTGLTADVIYVNNRSGKMRYEGDMGTILRQITK